MRCIQVLLLVVPFLLEGVKGHSRGAPDGACATLEPYHEGSRRNPTRNPYKMEAVVEGSGVTVTISGSPFKGYIVQGFSPAAPHQVLGTFSGGTNTIACTGPADTATHGNGTVKPSVSLTWSPPPGYKGDIRFRATVVEEYSVYYTNIYSNKIVL